MADQRDASNSSASSQTSADARRSYLALFNSIDQGFCTIDVAFDPDDRPTDCRFVEVNPSFARQTGIEHGAGRSMREIAPDQSEHWLEICGRVSLTGEPARFEQQSTPLACWWSVSAFRIEDRPRGQIGVLFNDITERKRGEDYHAFLLKLSDALRPLADPEAIQAVAADLLGAHLRVNHSHYAEVRGAYVNISHSYADGLPPMTGSFRADDFGKRLMDGYRAGRLQVCVDTATDPLFSAEERQMLKGAQIGAYIGVPLIKDGEWVGTFGVQTIEPREWTPSEIELVQEVTERTWAAVQHGGAAKALRKSEETYRTLFDSIDEGFTTLEVLFDEQGRAVDAIHLEMNDAYGRHSGASRELLGKRLREVHPTLEGRIFERYGRVALTGEPVRFEEHVALWDYWFDAYAVRVGGEGSHVVAVIFNNITERKRREHHAAFLDKLSQALVLLDTADEIVRATGEALSAHLDVSFVHVVGVELDTGDEPAEARLTALAAWEREGFFVASGAYRAGDYLSEEFLRAVSAGEPVVVRDTDTDPRTDREAYRAIGMRAFSAVPILKDGAWPGLISVGTPGVRDWRPDEVALIVEVANRVFPRIERSRAEEALRASRAASSARAPASRMVAAMKSVLVIVALLGSVLAGCKSADKPAPAPSAMPHDEAAIVELTRTFFAAFDGADVEAVQGLLAPDFVRAGRARFFPVANVLDNIRTRKERGFPATTGRTLSLIRVRFFGDTAVLTGMSEAQLVRAQGVAPVQIERSATLVWTFIAGAWKLANWQDEPAGPEADRMGWNETYRESGAINLEPNKLLVEAVHDRKPGKALDVGIGQGRNALFLASQGWDVTGVDISDEGIRQAHETAKAIGVTITTEVADIDTWDWGEATYDLVALIYMGNKPQVDKVRRALKPGGIVVIEFFRAGANVGTGISAFAPGALPELFKDGFKVLRHDETEDIADWGLRHVPLTRFVAEKL